MLTYGVDIGGSKISLSIVRHGVVMQRITFPNTFWVILMPWLKQ